MIAIDILAFEIDIHNYRGEVYRCPDTAVINFFRLVIKNLERIGIQKRNKAFRGYENIGFPHITDAVTFLMKGVAGARRCSERAVVINASM